MFKDQFDDKQASSIDAAFALSAFTVPAFSVALLLLTISGAVTPSAAEPPPTDTDVCTRMGDAMLKTAKTPYTSISIITLDAAQPGEASKTTSSRTSETIFTGDAVFVRSGGGRWRKIDAEISKLQELVRQASTKLGHCHDLGSSELGGTPVLIFSADDAAKSDAAKASETTTKQWVDKDRGVLVRSESNAKTKEGSRHSVIEYKYGSVAAPQL